MKLEYTGMYSRWCESIMREIEEIAQDLYPERPYWIDTGSRFNVCMKMLDQIHYDLKKEKTPWWRKLFCE